MRITHTDIWKFSIPMVPFRIATGDMHFAQNVFIRVHTENGIIGVGECSAFPVITGETQNTCFEMAKEFAAIWKNRNAIDIDERMNELDQLAAFNRTIKSAFDMALYDLAAKKRGIPLYKLLGGEKKTMTTDLTIGIDIPEIMMSKAIEFVKKGVSIIKIKLGKNAEQDVERVKLIRKAVGPDVALRIDANQGWSYTEALDVLNAIAPYNIEFCEQPMRCYNDHLLPELVKRSPIKIMADESVFDHHDALRLIHNNACDSVNIKFAKSGGIGEATKIHDVCAAANIACMMGGMLESRVALTAFAHFASAHDNIRYYDMDTCLLGHTADPVIGGLKFNGYNIEISGAPGIGADADDAFLKKCESVTV